MVLEHERRIRMSETKKIDALPKSKGGSDALPKSKGGSIEAIASLGVPRFEVSSFMFPSAFRAFAEYQAVQGKETLGTLSAAVQEAYSTSVRGFNEYAQKFAEAGQQDVDDACDCCRELIAAKSVTAVMDIWTNRAPRQLNAMSTRAGELWTLYWKVAVDTAKPIATGMSQVRSSQA
jgi:hypothetical protein